MSQLLLNSLESLKTISCKDLRYSFVIGFPCLNGAHQDPIIAFLTTLVALHAFTALTELNYLFGVAMKPRSSRSLTLVAATEPSPECHLRVRQWAEDLFV